MLKYLILILSRKEKSTFVTESERFSTLASVTEKICLKKLKERYSRTILFIKVKYEGTVVFLNAEGQSYYSHGTTIKNVVIVWYIQVC